MMSVIGINLSSAQKVGYPERNTSDLLKEKFMDPPKGYGEVPFYWWMGDTLTKEHLLNHLEILKDKGISSLQVNYAHSDKGGKSWGLTFKSKPEIFTEEWWNLFGWFMMEAQKRGMTVSLSDYTLGVGQEKFVDDALKEHPEIMGYELKMEKQYVRKNLDWNISDHSLSLVAYKMAADSSLIEHTAIDLSANVNNGKIKWKAPAGEWVVVNVYTEKKIPSYNPMHPLSGKTYVKNFFQRFEDHFPESSKTGLNFFFSDELNLQLGNLIWDEYFQKEFIKRKGYDIVPRLAALYENVGNRTAKYRLDYNDVMVSLSEENFFKPIYDWHQKRGLIYGCDHGGRGLDVTEFGDYFRTQRWNQGPGCDQSHLQKNVIKNKVASSIAHMYERPRTWLEGFYGSGWNTSSAMLADAIFTNFVQGQNLLSLHGLYYSTLGGWWEWAPPCNHFRMPYWAEMDKLLACTERLSYILSQGYHRADVALLYPVEPVIAGNGKDAVDCAFQVGRELYANAIDFDFMDYESLDRAKVVGNELHVSGEAFKVLIIPGMKTIRSTSLQKAVEFQKAGGLVLCLDILPEATELGVNTDCEVLKLISMLDVIESENVIKVIREKIIPDFYINHPVNPNVMHRKIGNLELYAVYNIKSGSECFFRAKGSVSLWNPWTGDIKDVSVQKVDAKGTYIVTSLPETEVQIYVFNPNETAKVENSNLSSIVDSIPVDKEWNVRVIPVLDNRWGDYHWPATNELIGAEIRSVKYAYVNNQRYEEWKDESVGYGPCFQYIEAYPSLLDKDILCSDTTLLPWKEYAFSWRWGVEGDYGHQGYHGLKAEMYNDFLRMGNIQDVFTELKRVDEPQGDYYYFRTYVMAEKSGLYDIVCGGKKPVKIYLNGKGLDCTDDQAYLEKGRNQLVLCFKGAGTTSFLFKDKYKEGRFVEETLKERPLAMKWNGDLSVLPMTLLPDCKKVYYYMHTAPGTSRVTFTAYADEIKAWVKGKRKPCIKMAERQDEAATFTIELGVDNTYGSSLLMEVTPSCNGRLGGAMFPYPIKQECMEGKMAVGDWGEQGGLEYFSGAVCYSKEIKMPRPAEGDKYFLDLGEVCSSAEVWINGRNVGTKLIGPWKFDITPFVVDGNNCIKVMVYNTAYNHYLSIPTMYRKKQSSGILGPVTIEILKNAGKKEI